jgi:WD40 repeat protein
MDSSGRIDSYEFICALALISHATLEEKARSIFKLYDFDDSMILNFDECVVLVRCCLCSLAALCGRKDVPSITEVEEKVTVMYSRHDRDEDGCLTLDEFISMVTKDKEVLSTLKNYDLLKSYDIRENFGFENQFPDCDSDLEKE